MGQGQVELISRCGGSLELGRRGKALQFHQLDSHVVGDLDQLASAKHALGGGIKKPAGMARRLFKSDMSCVV